MFQNICFRHTLNMHYETTHTTKKFACDQCDKVYQRKGTLKGHVDTVHKGLRFKCTEDNCKEEFMRKDQLKFHLLVHKGKYRFLCCDCGKGFNHKGNFDSHKDTHSSDKPYKCGWCNKYSMVYPLDLQCHIKMCNVEPHIPCTEAGCNELFSSNDYLRKHLQGKHKKGKLLICQICGKTLWFWSLLKLIWTCTRQNKMWHV